MKVGDKVVIGGKKFNVMFVYEDYVLVCMANADPDTISESTLYDPLATAWTPIVYVPSALIYLLKFKESTQFHTAW